MTNLSVYLYLLFAFKSFTAEYITSSVDRTNYLFGNLVVKTFAVKSTAVRFVMYLFRVATVNLFRLIFLVYLES